MEYTDNEKKAIERCKNPILLDIMLKQQKEIERLKRENKEIDENCNDIYVLYLKAKGRLREFVSEDELNRMECIGKYTRKYYIPKETIIQILNKYAHTKIGDMKIVDFYRELKELLKESD